MIKKLIPAVVIMFNILFSAAIYPQMIIKNVNPDEMFDIPEIGAIVTETKEGLEILNVMPKERLPQAYQSVDMQKGDKIMMINGIKVKKAKECKEIYNNLKVGGELKLGLSRGERMFITTVKKADPKSLPVVKRMIIKGDGKDLKDIEKLKPGEKSRIIIKNK